MKKADSQVARGVAARSYQTTSLSDNLRRFVESGIVNDHQKRALKTAGYTAYSHGSWSLNDAGRTEAIRLGYLNSN